MINNVGGGVSEDWMIIICLCQIQNKNIFLYIFSPYVNFLYTAFN